MPLSLVEALFCGRPALVTDIAGHAELITEGENGFLAEAATVADWLVRSEALVQEDAQAGRLPSFYRPDLHLLGDGAQPAPGR